MAFKVNALDLFREERYSCLDYHDVSSLTPTEKEVIKGIMCDTLYIFLQDIDYQYPVTEKHSRLRQEFHDWAKVEVPRATSRKMRSLDALLEEGVFSGESFYPFASHETKLLMAKITTLAIALDNDWLSPKARTRLPLSQNRFWQRQPVDDEFSSAFFQLIAEAGDIFGDKDPIIGTLAASSWSDFVAGCLMENQLWGVAQQIGHHGGTSSEGVGFCPVEDYPSYLRHLTGVPMGYVVPIFKPSREIDVPYSVWMSYLPALRTAISQGNDLFSYVKEMLNGECVNYVSVVTNTKRASGFHSRFVEDSLWTFRDSVCDLFQRVLQSCEALQKAFKPSARCMREGNCAELNGTLDELRTADFLWHSFLHGYIGWHIDSPRYHLDSLRDHLIADEQG
ncbi:hypothetical protein FE257_001190 [Aspergillus nanangensis]|uniref:Uncharacterized protein n=1 Tax=Aspergillus nanangensis TaxID=2582783 RepID=A0AAD4GPU5_ASPNN|nr:hypothetical protein FE257_001190 [Aspergillus nanangensis]